MVEPALTYHQKREEVVAGLLDWSALLLLEPEPRPAP